MRALADIPTVATSFAFRAEYAHEIAAMVATVRRHHPDWVVVTGHGVPRDDGVVTFDVEGPSGREQWTVPVSLKLGGGEDDWRRITRMKPWWLREVWRTFAGLADPTRRRMIWIDADARLNGPLTFEIDARAEVIASPWWVDVNDSAHDGVTTGLLYLQGAPGGPVARAVARWTDICLQEIRDLPAPKVPWPEGDQEVLSRVIVEFGATIDLVRLDHDSYVGIPSADGSPTPGALIDHWMMSAKMARPSPRRGPDWPPPEHLRRRT